jgi:hypothetical protein
LPVHDGATPRRPDVRLVLSVVLACIAIDAAAQPAAPTAREGRFLVEAQLSLGASAVDDLDVSTSWSVAGGVRVLPSTFVVARLRHTSPFYKSLFYDILMDTLFDLDTDEPGVDTQRTHETDLSLGLRVRTGRVLLEAAVGGALVYRFAGTDYDNRALSIVDGTIGVMVTEPERRPGGVDGWLFASTSVDTTGDFVKAHVGLAITHELGD